MTEPDRRRGAAIAHADLSGATISYSDLRGAVVRASDLSGVVMRAMDLDGADLDGEFHTFTINGVDVAPLVEAELTRRTPARALIGASDPDGLRAAWRAIEAMWEPTYERVAAMPAGAQDVTVGGEWSFAHTLRHLVFATDGWLRHGIQGRPDAFHPWGMPYTGYLRRAGDLGVDVDATPSYPEVLAMRADRVEQVRRALAEMTAERLEETTGTPPWEPHRMPVLTCLHVILAEECEHHRYAVRDLDLIEAGSPLVGRPITWRDAP